MEFTNSHHDHTLGRDYHKADLAQVCDDAIRIIESQKIEFDSFAALGISGLIVAPVLAVMMNKALTIVRKSVDGHSPNLVEGAINCRYIIIDDFVVSGRTVDAIIKAISVASTKSVCVGLYLHRDRDFKRYGFADPDPDF